MKFIHVYDVTSGEKRTIPESWLTLDHPQAKQFSKTPTQRKAEASKSDHGTDNSNDGASLTKRKG